MPHGSASSGGVGWAVIGGGEGMPTAVPDAGPSKEHSSWPAPAELLAMPYRFMPACHNQCTHTRPLSPLPPSLPPFRAYTAWMLAGAWVTMRGGALALF